MTFYCEDCWAVAGSPRFCDVTENPFAQCSGCQALADDVGGLLVVGSDE